MSILLKNGQRLVTTESTKSWESFNTLLIRDGVIESIDGQDESIDDLELIDLAGAYVLPGLIDISVKGSIASETKAAAAGGVTTLCCTPETNPVNDSQAATKLIREIAAEHNYCNVLPLGALTQGLKGEQLAEYAALKKAKCVALSNAYNPVKNLEIAKRCFEYAKTHDMSVFVNPVEPSLHTGVMHEGEVSTTIGLQGISSLAETVAVSQLIQLANATGVHLHLSQLSAAESVDQLEQAKAAGINVTADVAIQNLLYIDECVESFNSVYYCMPPLRGESDRLALIDGVNRGVIDTITSAHRPHEAEAKLAPFAEAEAGMSSIEFLLPLALRLADKKEMALSTFIEAMTLGASKVLHRTAPSVTEGSVADLCVFSPDVQRTIDIQNIVSHGKNTPLLKENLKGMVKTTILGGRVVYQADI
jgi:dihydroorotase